MNYYHITKDPLGIISGPHSAQSDYVRRLTRCGTPEVLDLSEFDLVPETRLPLGENQVYENTPVVSVSEVIIPARDKTEDELLQETINKRTNMRCTPRQARLALAGASLLTAVESWVENHLDPTIKIEFEYATEIRRDSPLVAGFAASSGISESDLDSLFEIAQTL